MRGEPALSGRAKCEAGGGRDPGNGSGHPKVCLRRARGPMKKEKTPQGSLLEEERAVQGTGAGEGSWLLPSWAVKEGGSRWRRGSPLTLLVGSSTD